MNKTTLEIIQNMDIGYTSTASKAAYKRYAAQKAAPLDFDIKINIDGNAITQEIENAFKASGATIE